MRLAAALAERPLVLDGGLATELERSGYDLSAGGLWSARLPSDGEVDAIVAVGVNCTDPDGLAAAIAVGARASGKP